MTFRGRTRAASAAPRSASFTAWRRPISIAPSRWILRTGLALVMVLAPTVAPSQAAAQQSITPPHPREQPAPEWPGNRPETHDMLVPVVVTVREDGSVESVQIEASLGPAFDEAAIATARRWTFEPARRDGVPVTAKIRAVVRFTGVPERASSRTSTVPPIKADTGPTDRPPSRKLPNASGAPPSKARENAASAPPDALPGAIDASASAPSISVRVVGERAIRAASESVQGRDVLQAAPHRTASDLLLVVPGVFITQHSGQGKAHQIFLRGFDAVHGQDIEIWVAGAPVNEVSNVHGQGYADMHFIMPEIVERIRGTPGAYDPRQGDFAVAGSIRFDLGYDEPGVTGSATLGSFGERRFFLAYHPEGAPETTFAAFETQSTDGFGPARAARRTSAIGQLTHEIGSAVTARLMASAYAARFDSAGVLRLRDIERGQGDRFASYDPKQGGASSRAQVVLELSSSNAVPEDSESTFSIAPYFIARSLRLRSNFTGFLEDPIEGDSTQQINEALTFGATGFYRRRLRLLSDRDALEAGFAVRSDWIEQSQRRLSAVNDKTLSTDVDAGVRAVDAAGYADASIFPVRRVAVRAGLRIDGLSYAVEDRAAKDAGAARAALGAHFGKKATLDIATLPGLHVLASYGDGFRSPQARSLGDGERTPFTRVMAFEGGLRYRLGEALQSSAAIFHTTLSEDLVFDQATARNEPVPATQRTGIALDLKIHPRPWITSSASFTYTRATFTASDATYAEGDLVPYAPQIVARSDVSFTPVLGRVLGRDLRMHAGAGLTFLAARPLPYAEMGHDVFLADASVGLRFKEIEIKADVYNLLDTGWYDGEFVYPSNFSRGRAAELVPLRHVTVGAPRTIFATVSLFL